MTTPCDVLLLAAFPPELAALRPTLGDALRGSAGGLDVAARAVGIGLATSAAGAASRIEALRPRGVVLLGTCGVYPGAALGMLGVAVGRRVFLVEPAAVEGRAAFPDPMSTELAADPALSSGIGACGGHAADVGTTLAVTTDDALAVLLARHLGLAAAGGGSAVEHLEAYGVAAACAAARVPFAAALGVANVVGSAGRAQWRSQHRAASDAAVRLVTAWIASGAPGLASRT